LSGRQETRLFGEPTGGYTTSTRRYALFDGSELNLAEAAMLDRTGAEFPDGIQPDVVVATDWTTYGTDADMVIAVARDWLLQQPSCVA
jgi:C-terminal processing protease CtpA/Prc